jgi:glycosyltransferase involved in cell wall biosynthesis
MNKNAKEAIGPLKGLTARVSVIVPVKNEAENLSRCLPALAWADEMFVVDSQSSDDTAKVAEQFGATVVQFHFNGVFPKKKNWALDNLRFRNAWVLIVDADEVVTPELAAEITRRVARDEADGYFLNSRYYFLGRRIRHCGYSECWNLRLFKHRLGRYEKMPDHTRGRTGDNEAHEHVELEGRVMRLDNELEHHAYPTVAAWVEKHNRYAIWEAALRDRFLAEPVPKAIGRGKRFKRQLKKIALRLPLRPLIRFVYAYILRLGFLDGKPGLYFCGLLAFYDLLAMANTYEQKLTRVDRTLTACFDQESPKGVGLRGAGFLPPRAGRQDTCTTLRPSIRRMWSWLFENWSSSRRSRQRPNSWRSWSRSTSES